MPILATLSLLIRLPEQLRDSKQAPYRQSGGIYAIQKFNGSSFTGGISDTAHGACRQRQLVLQENGKDNLLLPQRTA
jgi:hypothetical protein